MNKSSEAKEAEPTYDLSAYFLMNPNCSAVGIALEVSFDPDERSEFSIREANTFDDRNDMMKKIYGVNDLEVASEASRLQSLNERSEFKDGD